MGCCNWRCGLITGAVFGALVAILGGVLIPVGDILIESEAVIEPGTTAYDNWAAAGVVVYRQFWFFDVQNPIEVLNYGTSPVVIERGPYTYKTRYLPKDNIMFNPNMTVSFVLPLGAIFEPSMSAGSEEDKITSLNLAVAVSSCLFHGLLETLIRMSNSSLFQRRTVKELLWGYHDPLLKSTLGLFAPYNGTFDGPYNVFTGKDDISKVGIIDRWKGEQTFHVAVFFSDASAFAPGLDKKKPLYFFSSDICRSVSASYERSYSLKDIEVYRYGLLPSTLASPIDNPDNRCFCRNFKTTKNCTMAGVLDLSSCQEGRPIYMSLPHFLHGSPSLLTDVLGLSPNEEHHSTYLDVEPNTGFTLKFAKRIQVNMMYGPSDKITVLKKVKDYTIFPLVWMNEVRKQDNLAVCLLQMLLNQRLCSICAVSMFICNFFFLMLVVSATWSCLSISEN
uniref:Platelet glycoprotein 4 n=1 Tax=Salarias fasciatus TaxID=181472 RepID=A0A672GN56_SALFA